MAAERWFEDYAPGAVHAFGSHLVDEASIVEFGRAYDPQAFHVDPVAARDSAFGGLIASGWHTGAIMMRMYADHYLCPASSLGSPGVDELRWLRPVRPGDTLRLRVAVLEARLSRSKPDRGIVQSQIDVLNQDDERVMTMKAANLVLRRP